MTSDPSPFSPSRLWTASRLSFFYAAFFMVIGIQLPFWPVWLAAQGLGAGEIALLLALATGGRVLASPVFAHLADRLGERRRPMIVLAICAVIAFLQFAWTGGFWSILAVTILFTIAWAPLMPLGEILVATTARERNFQYGRLRLWGSLSFIGAAVFAGRGLVGQPADMIFWLAAGTLILVLLSCILLPDTRVPPDSAPRPRFRQFLFNRPFLLFLLSAAMIQSSHGVYYAFGTLHWKAVGYSEDVIGGLWAEGVIAEVVLFTFGAAVARRLPPPVLLLIGGVAGLVRWTATGLTDALPVLLIVQALHALTYGAAHLGAINYIMQAVPPALSATAMSFYSSVTMGLAMGISMLIAGPLFQAAGGYAYLGMTVLAGLGTVFALALIRLRQPDTS